MGQSGASVVAVFDLELLRFFTCTRTYIKHGKENNKNRSPLKMSCFGTDAT